MSLAPGRRLGPYVIDGLLGAGGMGEVYRAHDDRLGRDVAVKVLPRDAAGDASASRRLMREARLAAQLNHPHICTIYEVGDADGLAYIAMECVEGRPLTTLIGPRGLAPETVIRCGTQIADALAFAHDRGVIHRDLKCGNVMVNADGHVKVLDFGLARRVVEGDHTASGGATRTLTEVGAIVGTPGYMAPEVLRGGEADARSDLWSLGVMLYEMASGAHPFRGASSIERSAAILNEPPEALPARVPPGLAAVIVRCLARDPSQRYRHAREVRAALEGLAAVPRPGSGHAVRTGPIAWRSRPWLWVGAGALLLGVGVLASVGGLRALWPGRPGAGRMTSLAVLPLDNFSHDPDQQYFADGMTDELITTLAQIGALRVISRTSVMGFKATTEPLPEVARKLGVDAIIEGSVQRSGDRVRITAQLIRAATDQHLWAHTYERDLRDVLALQDEVAGEIAREVQGRLTPREQRQIAGGRTVSPRAYEHYLRGLDIYRRWERPSDRSALEFLDQAIREDSTYAPAWAAAGLVYLDEPGLFGTRDQDVARGRQLVEHALALDPNLGLAHSARAEIEFRQDWDWAGAEREFKRAIELSPSQFEAHHAYSHLLMTLGRVPESLEQSRLALAVDPLNTAAVLHIGWYDLCTGQYQRAIHQFEETLRLDPSFAEAYRFLSSTYVLTGDYDRAVNAQERAIALTGSSDTTSSTVPLRSRLALHALIAARRGNTDEALRMIARIADGVGRGEQTAYDLAVIYAQLGRKDEAFRWLDRSARAREEYLFGFGIKEDPFLAPLRSDPRFARVVRSMGLPA
jgi:eukaryotic-like serine/threonine-protein kinase